MRCELLNALGLRLIGLLTKKRQCEVEEHYGHFY